MKDPQPTGAESCQSCGEPLHPADSFCEACGAELIVRDSTSRAITVPQNQQDQRVCRSCGTVAAPSDGEYCRECGLRHRAPADRVEVDLGDLAGVSDRGVVRSRNEDAMALGRRQSVARAAVVCDGVSTSTSPELAAMAAADTTLDMLLRGRADAATRTRDAIAAASRSVAGLGHPPNGPSCTLVSAVLEPVPGAQDGTGGVEITVGWVGDSRAYWLAAPGAAEPAAALTTDHSWAVEMVAAGLVDAEKAATDRRAHAITRWLGPDSTSLPEVVSLRPTGPGALLLCTDGLWNHLADPGELADAALAAAGTESPTPLSMAAALTTVAIDAGGRDNITVVIIPVTVRSRP